MCVSNTPLSVTKAELEVMMTSIKVSDVGVTLVGSVISSLIFKLLQKSFSALVS